MKRLLEIMLLSVLTMVILSSGTTEKNIKSVLHYNSSWTIKDDTTDLISHIEVDTFKLTIIPPSLGVQFYKDGIVFLSMSKYERKMSANHISFGANEAYYATIADSVMGRHTLFSTLSSFSYPCEAMTFSHDYNTIYFTKFPEKDKKEKIYMAKFTSNSKSQTDWVSEQNPMDFCTDNSSYTHPTLSADEKMLIFASNKEGSVGGMDLFISRRTGDKWSAPENLGKLINTTGNEFFPFLDSENNLFFSSDGFPGYGGYDIFTCKFNGVAWDKPINLSGNINSENDDIAFTINKKDGKTAFLTRRYKSGNGEMQLFKVKLKEEAGDHNLLTISYIFNGKPLVKTSLITAGTVAEVKPVIAEPTKTKPEVEVIKKEEVKVPETTVNLKKVPEKKTVTKPVPGVNPSETKVVTTKITIPAPVEQKDVVIYRIQLLLNTSQKSNKEIIINGKSYKLYEYFYLGVNRYTIGEFSTLKPAIELQRICRQSGHPQSFVVAFKNNIRSLDSKLFK
jgi:WD40-like Beta Propeller Repeat